MSSSLIKTHKNSFTTAYRLLDVAVITGLLLMSTYFCGDVYNREYFLQSIIAVVLFLLFSESLELYRSWRMDTALQQLSTTFACWGIVSGTLTFILYFTPFFTIADKTASLILHDESKFT